MKKSFLIMSLLSCVVLLGGCAHQISTYSPSFGNMTALHDITISEHAKKINVGSFVDPKQTRSIVCRLEGSEELPGGVTYATYLKNALKSELNQAELYSSNSKIKLDATLDKINVDSVMGSAHWTIKMTFNDHIQKPYTVSSTYPFSSDFIADIACTQVAQSFVPAAQHFMHTLYANQHFKKTLRGAR